MSAVLQRSQNLYKKVIVVEFIVLVSIALLGLFNGVSASISLFLGGLASILPFCLFVYWVFFRQHKNNNKMSEFYRGEGLKWLATILLVMVALKGFPALNVLFFFGGYFLVLLCNSLLPIVLNR